MPATNSPVGAPEGPSAGAGPSLVSEVTHLSDEEADAIEMSSPPRSTGGGTGTTGTSASCSCIIIASSRTTTSARRCWKI